MNIPKATDNMQGSNEEPYIGMPIFFDDEMLDIDGINEASSANASNGRADAAWCNDGDQDDGSMDGDKDDEDEMECMEDIDNLPIAMAYVPWQRWNKVYEPAVGFEMGTIFPELNLPFLGGGK